MTEPEATTIAYQLFLRHRPADRPYTEIEALLELAYDAEVKLRKTQEEYALAWRRPVAWAGMRIAEARGARREEKQAALELEGGSAPRAKPRRAETGPPAAISPELQKRLRAWVDGHEKPEIRALAGELPEILERAVLWHQGKDTRHRNWLAVWQAWILREPRARRKAGGGKLATTFSPAPAPSSDREEWLRAELGLAMNGAAPLDRVRAWASKVYEDPRWDASRKSGSMIEQLLRRQVDEIVSVAIQRERAAAPAAASGSAAPAARPGPPASG